MSTLLAIPPVISMRSFVCNISLSLTCSIASPPDNACKDNWNKRDNSFQSSPIFKSILLTALLKCCAPRRLFSLELASASSSLNRLSLCANIHHIRAPCARAVKKVRAAQSIQSTSSIAPQTQIASVCVHTRTFSRRLPISPPNVH